MKWKKLGKIFDPTLYKLPDGCVEFAQAPQSLVFDDFVRIYFSTRQRDSKGKYLSHISFVDFDLEFQKVLRVSSTSVISLGKLGCCDEHGIFPLNVLRDGEKILGYIGGWSRRVSVSVDGAIGLALSTDEGESFTRTGDGPILAASVQEPFLIGDPFVAKFNDEYHMWYIHGLKWIPGENNLSNERVYKIGHAKSADGFTWTKTGGRIIPDRLNDNECQALPTVINIANRYHMLFCYRQAFDFRTEKEGGYRIGYTYSDNLTDWTRNDQDCGIDVSESGWDSEMLCYPHMFHCDGKVYLLYNGNEFGRNGFGLALLEDD